MKDGDHDVSELGEVLQRVSPDAAVVGGEDQGGTLLDRRSALRLVPVLSLSSEIGVENPDSEDSVDLCGVEGGIEFCKSTSGWTSWEHDSVEGTAGVVASSAEWLSKIWTSSLILECIGTTSGAFSVHSCSVVFGKVSVSAVVSDRMSSTYGSFESWARG